MDSLTKDFERIAKRQKISSSEKVIDELINEFQAAKERLTSGMEVEDAAPSVPAVLQDLKKSVDCGLEKITADNKELQTALSKYGKTIEKTFTADLDKICSSDKRLDQNLVNEALAQHFYREALFDVGETFEQEACLEVDDSFKRTFSQMYSVLESLRKTDVGPALEWCAQHKAELSKHSPSLAFNLHSLKFIQFVQSGDSNGALSYSRAHFSAFAKSHLHEISRLMGTILYIPSPESSPYQDILSPTRWDAVSHEFARACCAVLGLPSESPLYTSITVGSVALPTLIKLSTVLQNKDWASGEQMPVEIEVGKDCHFHSIFACPVSREQSTQDNPPMFLPCGHVIAKQSMMKLVRGAASRFKCPYCPMDCTVDRCKELKF